jgi:hypothetical protein
MILVILVPDVQIFQRIATMGIIVLLMVVTKILDVLIKEYVVMIKTSVLMTLVMQ